MKKEYVDFICALHGYLIRIKEIHWHTDSDAEHTLCDEILGCVSDCEDKFTECAMGMEGVHFTIGDLMPMLPNAEDLKGMLKELESDIIDMLKKLTKVEDEGLKHVLGELLEHCKKYQYRATQK